MKFTFTQPELDLLDNYAVMLGTVATKQGAAELTRTVAKMRYKFYGTPLYVNLTGKERKLILEMLVYRHGQLPQLAKTAGSEAGTIVDIMKKMGVAT